MGSGHLDLPLKLIVEVEGATGLLVTVVLSLHPGQESGVEDPTTPLQLTGGQVLLIAALLVVEGEEERLLVEPPEVGLSPVHDLGRVATLVLKLLISLLWWDNVFDRNWITDVEAFHILQERTVQE